MSSIFDRRPRVFSSFPEQLSIYVSQIHHRIPAHLIVYPLLLGCVINTFFPNILEWGSFTTAMTHKGTGALVGAFLFVLGTGLSPARAPRVFLRGSALIISKLIGCLVWGYFVLFICGGSLFGISAMAVFASLSGANNALFASVMKGMGRDEDACCANVTTLVVGPAPALLAMGFVGEAPLDISILGALLPIIAGVCVGAWLPSFAQQARAASSLLIALLFFSMGSNMTFFQIINAGLPGIVLGILASVALMPFTICADKMTGGDGVSGVAIACSGGANIATPLAFAAVDAARFGGSVLASATAQIAAATIVCALITPWLAERFARSSFAGARFASKRFARAGSGCRD